MTKLTNNRSNPKSRKIVNKISVWFAIILLVVFFFGILDNELSMRDYGITCAKFIRTSRGKSSTYYEFQYRVGDSLLMSSRGGFNMRIQNKETLKKMGCIKIVYSKKYLTNIRILDKRVARRQWLWFLKDADK